MKATTELFDLIKSLDGGEKGYFKKHSFINSKSNEEVNYLHLFDAIEKQTVYDEAALRSQFKNHAFAKQFPVAKTYLYNRILKALQSYHSSVFEEMRNCLHSAEILFYKKLYSQSEKALNKAKKLAARHDIHFYSPAILAWESNLAVATYDLDWVEKIISELKDEMSLLENNQQYNRLVMTSMVLINRYGHSHKKNLLKKLEQIMKHPALQNEKGAIGFTSQMNFFATHAFYWYAKENYYFAEKFFAKQLSLFLNDPEKTKTQFNAYLTCVNNLVEMLFQSGMNYKQIPKYLDILKGEMVHKRKPSQRALLFYLHEHNLLGYYQRTGEFDKAVKVLPKILFEYEKHKKELNSFHKTILLIKISVTWFGSENYNKCLYYLNVLRNEFSFKIQPDIDSFLHIFYIIVHYELKHYDLLPSLIQSANHFSEKQSSPGKFEKTLLSFFKDHFIKDDSGKILAAEFMELKKLILPLTKKEEEKSSLEFFDYHSWIESKIENRSFAEIVAKKNL